MLDRVDTVRHVDKLSAYRVKRKAGATPEPFGSGAPGGSRFVVQLHAADRKSVV